MKATYYLKTTIVLALVIPALFGIVGCCVDHDMKIVSQIQATCESAGSITNECRECGHEETERTPATGHSFAEKVVQEASCASTGLVEKICSICNKVETGIIEMTSHSYEVTSTKEATLEAPGVEESTCIVCGNVKQKELLKLGTKTNPGKVTIEQLVSEINSDKAKAATKYNDQWIEITGKVLDASNVAGMTRFYLYGQSGDTGLRIICWVNEEILKPFDYRGDTVTFLGQMREISFINATEIGSCTIISD